ncbi:HAMP domain-containing histidine kinase [bacterium]|nr:HAMP domain-containing histidine kinase [bacterium]
MLVNLVVIICLFSVAVCISYYFLYKQYKCLKKDISKLYIAVKRVRYGDINVRLQSLNDKHLEKTVNRLLETISDREMMIKEYQSTLSNKNISLEEIIKQEKQLRMFKEEFAATLTHDMKVPVIAELNSLNYLLDGRFGTLNDKQTEILKLMKSSNQELKELIENMLETYRLEQNTLQINLTDNKLNEFVENTVNEMKPIALQNSNNIIVSNNNTQNITLKFDAFQMKRVIKNIIQNAISFSPSSAEIKIETSVDEKNVYIRIENKGSNLSEEELELIFQKYYCGHSKFRKAGTGLGLYLAEQIMLAHDGNISVDCTKKELTAFIVELPLNL